MFEGVNLKFDGGMADDHLIGAREMGQSLIGVDTVVNAGMVLLTTGRAPKRGQRVELYLAAKGPQTGSVDLPTQFEHIAWVLPLVSEFVAAKGAEFVKHFLAYVLAWHGGRRPEGIEHMEKMIELVSEVNRSHEVLTAGWQATLLALVEKQQPAARQIVAPVGRSASTLSLIGGSSPAFVVDEPMAEAIRSKEPLEVKDLTEMTLKVDGLVHHARQMKVHHPEIPGQFLTCEVRDPLFDEMPNPYMDALGRLANIRVLAKPVYKAGQLYKIYVMDFVSDLGV